jgi:hypothetical protein
MEDMLTSASKHYPDVHLSKHTQTVGTHQSLDCVEGMQEALHQLPLPVVSKDPKAGCSELSFGKVQAPPPLPTHAQRSLQFLLNFQDSEQSHDTIYLSHMLTAFRDKSDTILQLVSYGCYIQAQHFVSLIKGCTQTENVWEQVAKENII